MVELDKDYMLRLVNSIGDEDKATGCAPWMRYVHPIKGPILGLRGENLSARGVLWRLFRGEIPQGQKITVTCGNARCVNVNHYELSAISRFFGKNAR